MKRSLRPELIGMLAGLFLAAGLVVLQMTPLHSSETRSEGINDTTSLEKSIVSVVSATFSMK